MPARNVPTSCGATHAVQNLRRRDAFAGGRDAHPTRGILFTILVLLAIFCDCRATEPDTFSPVVSYQYLDTLAEPGTTIASPVVSYQYFDWPGDENLTFQASPSVSYFFSGGVSLALSGNVRTVAGLPITGATVTLKRYGTAFWAGTTAGDGSFTAPNVPGANYTLIVSKPGYLTHVSSYAGTAGGGRGVEVRLEALPLPIPTQNTSRVATAAESSPFPNPPGMAPRLLLFNPETHQFDPTLAGLSPDRPTVILSHGWLSDPAAWAANLARRIVENRPPGSAAPNIVAWDWSQLATFQQMPLPNTQVAWMEGIELGKALQRSPLGSTYRQHIHFVGHSLGALVNSSACDYLHHGFPREQANSPTPWNASLTTPQVTLLDEAEASPVLGSLVTTFSQVAARQASIRGAISRVIAMAAADWKSPVPRTARWTDSYISAFGLQRSDAVNVCLLKPAIFYDRSNPLAVLTAAHAYAHEWYSGSVRPTGRASVISFGVSSEAGAIFPPSGAGRMAGDLWVEDLTTLDVFDQLPSPVSGNYECNALILSAFLLPSKPRIATQEALLAVEIADATGRAVMAGYESGIELVGQVGGNVIFKAGQVVSSSGQKLGQLWDAAQDAATEALDSIDPEQVLVGPLAAPVFSIELQSAAAPQAVGRLARRDASPSSPGQPANAWMTVHVPANAGLMAFDFTVTGEPQEDCVACAINGQNVFSLPAKFAPNASPVSTDLLDVSAYAGQTIELFFGLVGSTSTSCALTVDGIRFVTIPLPKLAVVANGPKVSIKWPAAAVSWILEESEALAPARLAGCALDWGYGGEWCSDSRPAGRNVTEILPAASSAVNRVGGRLRPAFNRAASPRRPWGRSAAGP